MASSNQSAVSYVRNAHLDLVGQLQNLPLIVEKLHQQGVFNSEEVSNIEALHEQYSKTRKILDWTVNKGEEACYQFLRILDQERNSVFPKVHSSHQASKLHTWITSFSFRDELVDDYIHGPNSCREFQTLLKTRQTEILEQQCRKKLHRFGIKGVQQNIKFIPLVLDTDKEKNTLHSKIKLKSKKCKKPRTKKMRAYIPRDTHQKSPEDLLNSREKRILLLGKPGIGKTTVVKQMLHHWAEKRDGNLDFMFYFDENALSSAPLSSSTVMDLLLDPFLIAGQLKDKAEEISQYLQNHSENVTIIFDGIPNLNENSVLCRIMEPDILPEAKIVATCRPEAEDDFSDWPTCTVYVQGFSEESIYDYFTQMSDHDPDLISSVVNNPALFSLCHVPMYAFMVAVCFSYCSPEKVKKQWTVSELYIRIFRHCVQRHGKKNLRDLDKHIKTCRDTVFCLAESAFSATRSKTINLEFDYDENSIADTFLRSVSDVSPAFSRTFCAFLHNTMQEFFSALWLLENPQELDEVLELCQTEVSKHMKHVIHFLCGLQSEISIPLLKCLFQPDHVKETYTGFFEKFLNTFHLNPPDGEIDVPFICQCLYELQSPEACCSFLEKISHHIDLSEMHLDPYTCCAVFYVISQSRNRHVFLDLENSTMPLSELKTILNHASFLSDLSSTLCQLWTFSLSHEQINHSINLLQLCENEIHLPVSSKTSVLQRTGEIITGSTEKINLHLHCDEDPHQITKDLCSSVCTWLTHIGSVYFLPKQTESLEECEQRFKAFKLDLCLQAALPPSINIQKTLEKVIPVQCEERSDFLLDLYSRMKQYESETGRSLIPALLPVYQLPTAWSIKLSERKSSLLLEVLKLQREKKPVELRDYSDEESEVRSFLECLPYISHLRCVPNERESLEECIKRFRLVPQYLCLQAALQPHEYIQKTLKKIIPAQHEERSDFLLDLYSDMKQYEIETGWSLIPALLPLYQSPTVWYIKLSERKSSLLLEVLKLQTEKKPVELRDYSDEESEVRSFLECLPYISELRFDLFCYSTEMKEHMEFLLKLFHQAAEREKQTGEKTVDLLTSLCNYRSFPYRETNTPKQCDFLLDLYSHMKQYKLERGWSLIPALLPVYQLPTVWSINLSERKSSLLLEVLKLQTEKKPVELRDYSDEESEMRSFLQCLPYISQLSCVPNERESMEECEKRFRLIKWDLCLQAALHPHTDIQKTLRKIIPAQHVEQCDFLLDLYSHMKQDETETGRSLIPALLPVYQLPTVWSIDLSERKSSLLLEVLKLQREKKPVELIDCSDEESEVRSFLQCLPYISHLRFNLYELYNEYGAIQFLINLSIAAADCQSAKGENITELLASVCRCKTFPFIEEFYKLEIGQTEFVLDLYSHMKQRETETGRSLIPALLPVYQSPKVWSIKLSERKSSLLLEVLKLQTEKKPVELIDCSDEESEVRSFLQCLPHISQLRLYRIYSNKKREIKPHADFILKILHLAVERKKETGDKTLELLTSLCTYRPFPFVEINTANQCDFLLDLYSHMKQYETETGRSLIPALLPVYQSPTVWSIKLSERKSSLLLEVLQLQTEKKPVELRDYSDEESEVRSFLQCLPYISQLRFNRFSSRSLSLAAAVRFFLNLSITAADCQSAEGESYTELLASVCSYSTFPFDDDIKQSDFLLDLYYYMKQYESETGRSLIPALLPVYQSPTVWSIDLSERKSSLLLEVLKLQTEKKPVELRDCSDEESEVRSFLQCLPYISQLRFDRYEFHRENDAIQLLINLSIAAADCQSHDGGNIMELLVSVCTYNTFPLGEEDDEMEIEQSDFLLDLYSHMKQDETETGRSLIPALLPVYQLPTVWSIDLSERKSSLLLEVLKLQTEKKPVELRDCSDEESEVRSFLQCLPYISQLRFNRENVAIQLLINLSIAAADCQSHDGGNIMELLASVCNYNTFPFGEEYYNPEIYKSDFLLDLYSHMKQDETETGRSLIPALLPVYQSPTAWSIKLSERKSSLLLEVLKLQTEKKPVKLRDCSDEESEVRSFLQCLPHISQLSFDLYEFHRQNVAIQFLINLSIAAADCQSHEGGNIMELLASVCTYNTFPFVEEEDDLEIDQSEFVLDLYSRMKQYETERGRSLIPALLPVYQSPTVWSIDLSERKSSLLLEVLKLQTEKKPVKLRDCSDEESEVRSFLQCLPYISQLSFDQIYYSAIHSEFFLKLFHQAAEREKQTGEKTLDLLTSLCNYSSFPYGERNTRNQSDFLLDLYSHMKQDETETGRSLIPALLPVYQSPTAWSIKLSERKSSLLLEVLKLQTEKKPVELIDCSDEESEVRRFLRCLPYISQLSFDQSDQRFIPNLSKIIADYRDQKETVKGLLEAMDYTLIINWILPSRQCRALGKLLRLSGYRLKLTLKPQAISLQGIRLLFRHTKQIYKLWLSDRVIERMSRAMQPMREAKPMVIQELYLVLDRQRPVKISKVLSNLTSLLSLWSVRCLNLTECNMEAQSLTGLMCHPKSFAIRVSKETLQQFADLVFESQDRELNRFFLKKVGGDFTSCCFSWEELIFFLKEQICRISVNMRKSNISKKQVSELLPLLSEVQFRRLSSSVMLSIIREIYETRSAHCVTNLLSSTENSINLNNTELDSHHCAALCFTLQNCTAVSLSLLWTFIPEGELERNLLLLERVSQLSVDRIMLLRLLHCCSISEHHKGASLAVLSALQNRLDFSSTVGLDLTAEVQDQVLHLAAKDCTDIVRTIMSSNEPTELILEDCEIEDAGVDLLFSILHTVKLCCSKPLLLQFLALVQTGTESVYVRRAGNLSKALDGQVDLSGTKLDLQACKSLALVLEYSEEVSELDLSHCQLTDQCLELLIPHLHKTAVLDLSHNEISDSLAGRIYTVLSDKINIQTVRLFNNRITNKQLFQKDKRFEIW